jgi:hypothetical protein
MDPECYFGEHGVSHKSVNEETKLYFQRDNITFGLPFEEDKYWQVIETACLLPDLQQFPDGDLSEVRRMNLNAP